MKKTVSLLLALLVCATCLCLPCHAEELPLYGDYTDDTETCLEVLDSVWEAAFGASENPVADVRFGESHCAILFEDGTVDAFPTFCWYGSPQDFGECSTGKWKGVTKIACGAETTYGLTEKGGIVWSGNPQYLGYDADYIESETVFDTLSKKDYKDIATSKYAPLFLLKKNGTIAIEMDPWEDFADALEWKNIVDIECTEDTLFALQKDGTVLTDSWGTVSEKKVAGAVGLKNVGVSTYAVLKDGSLQRLEPESEYYDWCVDTCPETEEAEYIWLVSDFDSLYETMLYENSDGSIEGTDHAAGWGMDRWDGVSNIYAWTLCLPGSIFPAEEAGDHDYYATGSQGILLMGVFEDGSCRVMFNTIPSGS